MGVFVVNSGGWQGDALLDPKFHDSFLADVRKSLDYHKVMRNRWCTVTSGLTLDYLSPSRQTQNLIDGLKKAVEIIADSGLTLVLEPLNVIVDHPGYHVVTSEHAAQVIDGVGSEQVKILFDIYHQQISEGNLIHNIEKHWDRIGYFQIGDVPGRLEPGTGEIRYAAVFRRIYELGYEGILGMEHRLSGEGREGMDRCFEAYRQVDTW
jgi:hydroxypyruvate isomerase